MNGTPDFFLAYGRDTKYEKEKPYHDFPSPPFKSKFYITSEQIVINRKYSEQDVNDIILDGHYKAPKLERLVDEALVRPRVAEYKTNPTNNLHPLGFFPKENFEELLDQQELIGIRYYFGYDGSLIDDKIRIVMVGVRHDWSNISTLSNRTDGLFLERSWPPPPPESETKKTDVDKN
jgi:hypothetical protein